MEKNNVKQINQNFKLLNEDGSLSTLKVNKEMKRMFRDDSITFIGINRTQLIPGYDSVYVVLKNGKREEFSTGDIVSDFEDAVAVALADIARGGKFMYSSSVDDFLSDTPGYRYNYHHMIEKIDDDETQEEKEDFEIWRE